MLVCVSTERGGCRNGRRLTGVLVSVLLTAGCIQASSGAPAESSRATTPESTPEVSVTAEPLVAAVEVDLRAGIDAATAFGTSQGLSVSIAVIDRARGEEVANGAAADTPIWGASLVKLFIADNLLHRQRDGEFQLSAQDRSELESMLVASDDVAADSLYTRFGGEAMVTEVAQRYQLPSVVPTNQAGFWELTMMSARDVARYYDRFLVRTPPADRDYLLDLLRRTAMIAIDGFDQFFGIPTALPAQTWAIKQGWMCCPRDTSYLHTTGVLGTDDRYVVAILSSDPGVFSTAYSTDVLSRVTSLIFPPGSIEGG